MRTAFVIAALCAAIASAGTLPPLASLSWSTQDVNTTGSWTNQPISTTVANGTIYTATYNYGGYGALVATNGSSGATQWWINLWGQPVWASSSGGSVFVATTWYVAGISQTGSTIWNFSFPDSYRLSTSGGPSPVWLDADCFVAFVSVSNSYARLYHFNAADGNGMSLWNSTTNYPSNSNCGLNGPTTVGWIGGSLYVVQVLQASQFVAINISNSTGAQLLSHSGDISNTGYMASIFNSTIYFGGTDYGSSNAKIVGYAVNGTLVFSASWASLYQVNNFQRFSFANGTEGFAVLARTWSSSVSKVFSIDMNGNPTTAMLTPNTYYQRCYVIATDSSSWYLNDDDLNVMRYPFGGSNWSWIAPSLFTGYSSYNNYGASANAAIFGGKLYFQRATYFNGSSYLDGALVQLDIASGAYTAFLPTPRSSSYTVSFIVFDPVSFGGSIVCVGESNSAGVYLFNMLPNAGASVGTWLAQPIYGVPYVYAGKVYFVATNTIYCFGLLNGTLLWSQYVSGSSWSYAFDSSVAPIVVGGLLYVQAYYDSRIYVFDYLNRVTYFSVTIPSTITNCIGSISNPKAFVQDPYQATSPWVYFAGGSGYCVVRFNAVGSSTTATWEAAKGNTNSVYNPPVVGSDYVWFTDYYGYTFSQRKSLFTSTLIVNNMKTSSALAGSYPSPLTWYSGTLFVTCTGQIVSYGATTLIKQSSNILASVDSTVAPIIFNNQLFLTTVNGSFVSYGIAASGLSMALPLRFYFSPPASWGSVNLGVPVVAPFGLFVFANSNGILGVDWNGNLKFTITTDRSGAALSCDAPTAIREGIAYVVCGGQLQMVDVLRGQIWMSGPQFYSYNTPTIVVDTSSELSLGVFTIYRSIVSANNLTQMLYQPNQLPPSLNAAPSLVQELEQNKIWIAGLVAGFVVLIIIIAVAVKVCGGGKKDTDYVAMQNPVNQGGV